MKKRFSITFFFLITVGVVGVIVTLGYDYLQPGEPEFGNKQFMGFVASIMIILAGLRKSANTKSDFWDFVSLFIYVAGLLYLVLMPRYYYHPGHTEMLELSGFSAYDFILNIFGFIPLGYLLMSIFNEFASKYSRNITFLSILVIGILLSFLIEIGQYYILGRTSSLIDVTANGMGHLAGMLIYFLDRSISERYS